MLSSYLIFANAVDGFLDWLVPVVFFCVFFLSVISSAKKKAKDAEQRRAGQPSVAPNSARNTASSRRYPLPNGAEAVMDLLSQAQKRARRQQSTAQNRASSAIPTAEPVVALEPGEGESHVTPMGEPYHSSLVGETPPSIEHSQEHIGAEMPEGTVAPPPPGATVKAGANISIRRARAGTAALPRLRLKRGQTALRSAFVLREVLSRPRAYDI